MVTWPYPDDPATEAASTFADLIRQASDEHLLDRVVPTYDISRYEVGPAAEGLFFSLLCTMVRDVRPYLNDAASLIALSIAARAVFRRMRSMLTERQPYSPAWAPDYQPLPEAFRPVFSEPIIIGLCYAHFSECYGTGLRVSIDAVSRSPDPQFLSASHPSGAERYTVRIWTGQTSFVYMTDGHGEAIEHFKIRGRTMEALPIPNWFDESDFQAPAPSKRTFYEQSHAALD